MSTSLTGHPFQHISVTLQLAGTPEFTFSTHGDGKASPGSHIIVGSGDCCLIYLHDRAAVRTYAGAWLSKHTALLAGNLPAASILPPAPGGQLPSLLIHATGEDHTSIGPGKDGLIVRIGKVTWICRDQEAFTGQQHIWATVLQLAKIILPEPEWRRARRR